MKDEPCMRWSPGGRQSWRRRRDGGFDSSLYEVREIGKKEASPFVASVHYLRTMPSAGATGCLRSPRRTDRRGDSAHPGQQEDHPDGVPELDPSRAAERGRFVLLDRVPTNGN